MYQRSDESQLDLDLLDALAGLISKLLAEGEGLAKDFGVPAFFIKALRTDRRPAGHGRNWGSACIAIPRS